MPVLFDGRLWIRAAYHTRLLVVLLAAWTR